MLTSSPTNRSEIASSRFRLRSDGTATDFNVKVGDTVLVGRDRGTEVRIAEQKYTIVREDDIRSVS